MVTKTNNCSRLYIETVTNMYSKQYFALCGECCHGNG